MTLATRLRALEDSRRRAEAHPMPSAVVVVLAGDGEPDPATRAEVDTWTRRPLRERLKLAPWGILTLTV